MVCWKKRVSLENPAAYNDVCFITKAIEDSGLPWCNGALGLVKRMEKVSDPVGVTMAGCASCR